MCNDKIKVNDKFWLFYQNLVRDQVLPYQWKVLSDEIDIDIERERNDSTIPNEKSHAIENFKIAAGQEEGTHYGWVFQDSDVYKWLEAVAYVLDNNQDEFLKSRADYVIDLIGDAQEEDGYLDTYFTICAPDRKFKCLAESHELYCAGHLFEAAAAYYEATGDQKLLEIACKYADYIDSYFGEEEGKHFGFDGHEEIEIGLMRLYHVTGEVRYLKLCKYFLYARGTQPDYFDKQRKDPAYRSLISGMDQWPLSYYQAHKPVLDQDTAEGHAVRLVYLCTAMADYAACEHDDQMLDVCKKIWRNIVDKRMYITGGIGSTVQGESFTFDYDLPNDTMYCETCASVGLIFFAHKMLSNEINGEYGDIMERALYNTALAGMSRDGRHFFYVNPLEVNPENSHKDPGKSHVKCVRPEWLGCACCPPNLARLLASIEKYAYIQKDNLIASVLFMNCDSVFETDKGTIEIVQTTDYPWYGTVSYEINCGKGSLDTFAIRIPSWADQFQIFVNGEEYAGKVNQGFIYVHKDFEQDKIVLKFNMNIIKWYANPFVRSDVGKVAISRGPFIYCMEGVDNGSNIHLSYIKSDTELKAYYHEDLFGGIVTIEADGYGEEIQKKDELPLYRNGKAPITECKKRLKWIPYFCWANRGETEMQVWIREL